MRTTLALFAALAIALPAATALAQDSAPAGESAPVELTEEQMRQIQEAMQAQMAGQAQPPANPIPVPEGEVVNKEEREGVLIEDIKIGDGYEIKAGNVVLAHYHGTLKSDGTVFDSSFERGEPVPFPLSGVIKGWGIGVPGMKLGGVRRLTIPAALAYGDQSPDPKIPPQSDMVFVIQAVDAVQTTDTVEGSGALASFQSVPVTTHVIKDADGKVLETRDAANPYVWFPNEFQSLQYALDGMKVGGKRTLVIPATMNQQGGQYIAPLPSNVPLTVELELIAVRNMNEPGR